MGWFLFKHVYYSEEPAKWVSAENAFGFGSCGVAERQAPSASTTFVLCHHLPLLLGIIVSPWLDASIF